MAAASVYTHLLLLNKTFATRARDERSARQQTSPFMDQSNFGALRAEENKNWLTQSRLKPLYHQFLGLDIDLDQRIPNEMLKSTAIEVAILPGVVLGIVDLWKI
ncbi:hypothetical protein FKM82_024393 [Ascaphus truei]